MRPTILARTLRCGVICVASLAAGNARAQNSAQTKIPVRELAPALAVSRDTFGAILTVRQLRGGHVLVNDARRKRLLVLDSTLRVVRVTLDSTSGAANSYGQRPVPVIPYRGDSSIFVDAQSRSLVLIDPDGNLGRVMSAPGDPSFYGVAATAAGVDDRGRLLWRGISMREPKPDEGLMVILTGGGPPISNADSQPIIRGDFEARRVDTVAALQNLSWKRVVMKTDANGATNHTSYVNPLRTGDEWTVLSDGAIAIVRGRDYHVDWITSDGTKSSTDKLPFDWKRLSDDDKQRIRDSAAVAVTVIDSIEQARRAANGGGAASGGGGNSGRGGRGDPAGDGGRAANTYSFASAVVPVSEIPDYVPPIRPGAVRADLDGHLWILPSTSAQSHAGELVYDVVNRAGVLFERVRVPPGRLIAGFGRGGVVYLMTGTLRNGFQLERTRIQPTP